MAARMVAVLVATAAAAGSVLKDLCVHCSAMLLQDFLLMRCAILVIETPWT